MLELVGVLKILDLFCGADGAAMGYHRAGFEVVGVDIKAQPNYPFEFVRAHALFFPLEGFDAVHASPPCQWATAYKRRGHVKPVDNLVHATRRRLRSAGKPYVIENVEQARRHLVHPIRLCGSSFLLNVRRHRLFELGAWEPTDTPPPCDHAWQTPRFPPATNRTNLRCTVEVGAWRCAHLSPLAMDIDWMTNAEISQAIPPAYTNWIGTQLRSVLEDQVAA